MTGQTHTGYERHAPERAGNSAHRKSVLPWLLVLLAVVLLGWYLLSRRAQDALAPAPTPSLPIPASSESAPTAETPGTTARRPARTASAEKPRAVPAKPAFSTPERIAGQSPEPEYPTQSLRKGEGGTVLLRVNVGADGRPGEIDFARRSGSRELDRAAQEAVGRWRFTPAMRDGKAVAAVVEVPIEFKPQQ